MPHTFGTALARAGAGELEIMQALRQKTPEMARRYIDLAGKTQVHQRITSLRFGQEQ